MEVVHRKFGLTVTNKDGDTFDYAKIEGSHIIRSEANVEGYTFSNQGRNKYWKKAGRGGVKNREQVEAKLVEVDSYLYNDFGFRFN
jgi:hypothetical protein